MRLMLSVWIGCLAMNTALAGDALETRWMRDSAEYFTLAKQTYRLAEQSVRATHKAQKNWAVVLDLDETVIDNSTYQIERRAYGTSFDMDSWNAWCERRTAGAVPGAKDFVDAVRKMGGHIIYLSNRHNSTETATIDNLKALSLWSKGDTICLKSDDEAYTKGVRRTEVRTGLGECAVKGKELVVLAYLGDNIHDFPEQSEEVQEGGRDAQFGHRYFMFPNPMYGSWSRRITRPLGD
jgi:5'-nucleotidase (lipoprotein e(P4) family)